MSTIRSIHRRFGLLRNLTSCRWMRKVEIMMKMVIVVRAILICNGCSKVSFSKLNSICCVRLAIFAAKWIIKMLQQKICTKRALKRGWKFAPTVMKFYLWPCIGKYMGLGLIAVRSSLIFYTLSKYTICIWSACFLVVSYSF